MSNSTGCVATLRVATCRFAPQFLNSVGYGYLSVRYVCEFWNLALVCEFWHSAPLVGCRYVSVRVRVATCRFAPQFLNSVGYGYLSVRYVSLRYATTLSF